MSVADSRVDWHAAAAEAAEIPSPGGGPWRDSPPENPAETDLALPVCVAAHAEPSPWLNQDRFHRVVSWLASTIVQMLIVVALGLIVYREDLRHHDRVEPLVGWAELTAPEEALAPQELVLEVPAVEPPPAAPLVPVDSPAPVETAQPLEQLAVAIDEAAPAQPGDTGLLGSGALGGSGLPTDLPVLLSGRSPQQRAALVRRDGGSPESEEAVERGLRWIARHQEPDGRWLLHAFHRSPGCDGTCNHAGMPDDVAGTALAVLPFLGAGYTHRAGPYQAEVRGGLTWLIRNQQSSGDLRAGGMGTMYSHGLAAIVLCEAYALTNDSGLREPAQRALAFIVKAQHRNGGWRYQPGMQGDTSVLGWQVMALRSGQLGGLDVPEETLELARAYLTRAQVGKDGSQYGYVPGSSASSAMTAEGLLCRMYLGWEPSRGAVRQGASWLSRNALPSERNFDMYGIYYGTQVLHHVGGSPWQSWNKAVRDLLVATQQRDGHAAGSWSPHGGPHDRVGGRLYMTSLAVCTLEVYYRHLPLYRARATLTK